MRAFDWQFLKLEALKMLNNYSRGLTAYIMLFTCGIVMIKMEDAPVYPVSYYTLGWFLALFFPLIAICFIISSIKVRYNEIIERFALNKLWFVYYPAADREAEYRFSKFLWNRVNDYYDLFEFVVFSLLAGALTILIYLLIITQFKMPDTLSAWSLKGPIWAVLAGSGFLGSISGAFVFILRRYRMFDLRPMAFLQTTVALIAGTCSGAFITTVYPSNHLGILAFIIGFLSAINIEFLPNLMRSQFAKLTGSSLPEEIQSDLPKVVRNTEAVESLNSISVFSICELANADPIRLYLNMPQQVEMINTMVDQAILHLYFSSVIVELEQVNIHRFTQLFLVLKPMFSNNTITWPENVSIIDNKGPKDKMLLEIMKGIVESHLHHRILGLLLEQYRETFFKHK